MKFIIHVDSEEDFQKWANEELAQLNATPAPKPSKSATPAATPTATPQPSGG